MVYKIPFASTFFNTSWQSIKAMYFLPKNPQFISLCRKGLICTIYHHENCKIILNICWNFVLNCYKFLGHFLRSWLDLAVSELFWNYHSLKSRKLVFKIEFFAHFLWSHFSVFESELFWNLNSLKKSRIFIIQNLKILGHFLRPRLGCVHLCLLRSVC